MSKFTIVLLLAVAAVCVQGQRNRLETAAQTGNWDEFNVLLLSHNSGFGDFPAVPVPSTPQDIKNLKPAPGTKVYGQSLSSFKSTSTVNGRRTEYSAGHKVINNNGKVQEINFKPKN